MKQFAYGISFACFMSCQQLVAQSLFSPLPRDEKEASFMLREGTLDSVTWQLVRPYYEQPIMVPSGELRLLADVFPAGLGDVPVSPEDLARYEPWSPKQIALFFNDYPEMSDFKPILCFETTARPHTAELGCALSRYNETEPGCNVRFSSSLYRAVAVQGMAALLSNSARWQRRCISARYPYAGKLTIGNYDLNMDNGLLYGYFSASDSDTGASLNWRYAGANAWNGALYEFGKRSDANGVVFYHERIGETAYGARCAMGLTPCMHAIAGVSRAFKQNDRTRRPDTISYFHAGLTYNATNREAGVLTGVCRNNPSAIPFIAYVKQGAGGASVVASYTRIPEACPAHFSATRHIWSEKIDGNDSARGDVNAIVMKCRLPLLFKVRGACGVSYYYTAGKAAAESFTSLSGAGWVNYETRYAYRRQCGPAAENHTVTATIDRRALRWLECAVYCRYVTDAAEYQSVFTRISAKIVPSFAMEITPFVAFYGATDKTRECCLGLTQTLHLLKRTWSQLKLEGPLFKSFPDRWILDAKAYFYL
jgi:hypothetical protein